MQGSSFSFNFPMPTRSTQVQNLNDGMLPHPNYFLSGEGLQGSDEALHNNFPLETNSMNFIRPTIHPGTSI